MIKYNLAVIVVSVLAARGAVGDPEQDYVDENIPSAMTASDDMETLIKDVENIVSTLELVPRSNEYVQKENIEKSYAPVLDKLEIIAAAVQDPAAAYSFLSAGGIQRVVIRNIRVKDDRVTRVLLTMTRTLFEVVPSLNKVIPTNVVDKLLDIVLEDKEDIELKSLALDIMHAWLPNNPAVQARIMKVKGLESFYNQLSKLDSPNGNKLLDLFNIILEEHMQVLDKRASEDYTDVNIYKTIGLIERMSTSAVCNGLLNIFRVASSRGITVKVYNLVKNVQGFCLQFYKGRTEAIKFFDDIYEYLSEKASDAKMNVTEEKEWLRKYVDYLKVTRNEL